MRSGQGHKQRPHEANRGPNKSLDAGTGSEINAGVLGFSFNLSHKAKPLIHRAVCL
jgi:hypothetical protein